ncbi:hypothetical protein BKA56DRAFT_597395 [Ilyonectria sp. MPI-CAGE-AT-0026]|nr:hypothetical protein BKA56DRAFT_597395 [Ilyonectria sp. MPI-CAGE-AT-0026]
MASPDRSLLPAPEPSRLVNLPAELRIAIVSYMPKRDIKSLRRTCKLFGEGVLLHIDRVFLSANPIDIKVLRAIAKHETYRHGVVELIWDDARLDAPPDLPTQDIFQGIDTFWKSWYEEACESNAEEAEHRKGSDVDRPDHAARDRWITAQPSTEVLLLHFKKMFSEQCDVSRTNRDASALKYALARFPSLRKITLTPATHGVPFTPLYQTPMIRALPYGYNYPIPRGWPVKEPGGWGGMPSWQSSSSEEDGLDKNKWRGFCIITQTLAREKHNISEFVVDVSLLNTGLNIYMFDKPCDEYNDFVTMLRKPGFRRIDLAFLVDRRDFHSWDAFANGRLRSALALATDLDHVSLSTNVPYEVGNRIWAENNITHFVPLRAIFSVKNWPKLGHFGLSGFVVQQDDIISLLAALPPTLRSVELSFLYFLEGHGTNREFLAAMRDTLDWRERPVSERPRITMGWQMDGVVPKDGRALWVDEQVNEFVYGHGENPFREDIPNQISTGAGTRRDIFEPAYERPNVEDADLIRMGIIKELLPEQDSATCTCTCTCTEPSAQELEDLHIGRGWYEEGNSLI